MRGFDATRDAPRVIRKAGVLTDMSMPSSTAPDVWLRQFCARYSNRQRIHDIPTVEREQWGSVNAATGGILIPAFMTIETWGASPGTLITAATLIRRYAVSLMRECEAVREHVAALEEAARRLIQQNRQASRGNRNGRAGA